MTLDRNLGLLKTEYDDNLISYLIQQDREIRSVVPHFNPTLVLTLAGLWLSLSITHLTKNVILSHGPPVIKLQKMQLRYNIQFKTNWKMTSISCTISETTIVH